MKAARLYEYDPEFRGPEFLKVEEVPDPEIQEPDDVIIRIGGAGLCRTDLHIIEGIWRGKVEVDLPYILGHENAGWVEEVGRGVRRFRRGDPVIVHPLITDGVCPACRRGNDMHCENGVFPGINRDGGFAQYLLVKERNLVRLPDGVEPREVAPHADAGLTAYHAAKKAVRVLEPGDHAVIIGMGGLGHIAFQVLRTLSPARIIVVDRSDLALSLAQELGAEYRVKGGDDAVREVLDLTGGRGAQAVLDFVGEGGSIEQGLAMTRNAGYYFVIGYGGTIRVPAIDMIFSEKNIVGNLVGTYTDLVELMTLAGEGRVRLATVHYRLDQVNQAIADLHGGRVKGRAVLVP
ncbi:NAD(P)-dependent alcohol dehydrogenase [Caldinitratiruptor microaerophilus]|uniref:Alcohol dehydrogenase n=1 Tax=Caldinitratiruptor microaerophilus TaxID=671077 RepID=A0AA35CMW6_9FIRM|nr:NAD(P)-dependent alcohol dehydrogenase [Caldinitratiruptor microaerophilus]BDG60507.1 D-arabinose dehydrogenase [Caldinitratiruptor microaerophilus]